jgi:hypothetical protein
MNATASREQKAHALGLWREAHEQLARGVYWQHQTEYERALAQVLISLRRYSTFDELVSAYYASEATDEIEAVCRATCVLLNFGVVEDTAHWRRFHELRQGTNTTTE